ncbi:MULTISPECIES: hypothetical protein [Sphingobium]|jgi:hypothetical protein|uniref:hypothetical protein n=1 Tax=Sphingobium TaxID=165695 RepID=UPI000DBB4058|nr:MULTISPECIES: hypothetical protein [Sphingobium]KAA9018453.1 hypothetical protein F4U94_05270 [Sphingobium limneticum]MBU0933904.1 hypothetical protein [Alphaproteobacteria bacterium]BBC99812.1 hypothetical protein YGS_C1P1068 [Sphingobium sp. YG1]
MTAQSQSWFGFKKPLLAGLALAAMLGAGPSAFAADATPRAQATKGEVKLTFAPPLDQPMRYEVSTLRSRGGQEQQGIVEQVMRFRRDGEGYVLRIELMKGTLPGLTEFSLSVGDPKMPPSLRPFMEPMEYDVGADGEVLRMRDWDALKGKIGAGMKDMVALIEPDEAKRAPAAAMIEKMAAGFQQLSPEQAAQLFLKPWATFLGLGRNPREPGEWYEADIELDTGIFPMPLPATSRMRLTRPAAAFHWEQHTQMDPKAAGEAITSYLETMIRASGDKAPEGKIAEMRKALGDIRINDVLEADIDPATGMVIEGSYIRSIEAGGQKGGNGARVKRLD